ncbi:MAG: hypothetical protein QOF57_1626 [Frankiaceae bacterium]|nr:hypothetical protein [Frankiaceae bacterium]
MNDTQQSFEERLLTELRAVVATNGAPLAAPLAQRTRSLRQPLMAGGTLVGAGVITAAFLLTGATSPAYAVAVNPDGSVTVTISSLRDGAGLQAKLKAAGVNSVVDYLPEGKACAFPRYQPAPYRPEQRIAITADASGAATFTVGVGQVQHGETLVIQTSTGVQSQSLGLGIASGTVTPCEVVDITQLPAGSAVADPGALTITEVGDGKFRIESPSHP